MLFNIIGFGFIGQATGVGLKKIGYNVRAYDIAQKKNIYKEKEFKEISQIIGELPTIGVNIVCIKDNVLEGGKQDISILKKVLDKLNGTTILRSTILPGLLKDLRFDFYWPEFLHEKRALEEFIDPAFVVVGRRNKKKFPINKFKNIFYCIPEEASHIKYLSNIWNATRIAFVNEFGDNLAKNKINKNKIIDFLFKKEKYLKWGNAYGGHCLPKDISAYTKEYNLPTLKAVIQSNNEHFKKYPKLKSIY